MLRALACFMIGNSNVELCCRLRRKQDRGGGNRRGGDRGGGGRDQGRQPAPMPPGPGPDIKKAETPWQIGQVKSDNDKLLRSVKGSATRAPPPLPPI